ncbi:MAG: hypothetical protein WB392_11360 [Methanotrichaceae archaeon]
MPTGSSIKFSMWPMAKLMCTIRSRGNMELYTAADQAIVEAAGARVFDRHRRDSEILIGVNEHRSVSCRKLEL